jgi:hypothetical protein
LLQPINTLPQLVIQHIRRCFPSDTLKPAAARMFGSFHSKYRYQTRQVLDNVVVARSFEVFGRQAQTNPPPGLLLAHKAVSIAEQCPHDYLDLKQAA